MAANVFLSSLLVGGVLLGLGGGGFGQATSVAKVQGQLLKSDGKPLAYTELEMVPIDSERLIIDSRYVAATSLGGKFTFLDVPPGKYTLSINFDDKPTDLSPYDTYFYPATTARSAATVIEVLPSARVTGLVFKLPPALTMRRMNGRVLWPDGTPVRDAWIAFRDVSYDRFLSFGVHHSDINGGFTVTGFNGREYQFGAIVFGRPSVSPLRPPREPIAGGESAVFRLEAKTGVIEFRIRQSEEAQKLLERFTGNFCFPRSDSNEAF